MIIAQASEQPKTAPRATDGITVLGYAFGWVMIAIGLWLMLLALAS